MPQGQQVKNGKAFEFALANQYVAKLQTLGVNVQLIENSALEIARGYYQDFDQHSQQKFDVAASSTIDTMLKIEPGLSVQSGMLKVYLSADGDGANGDVRDVVFQRAKPTWEIGFSAKNNNDAVKHSRLSSKIDFGNSWVGVPCSDTYWERIKPIFNYLEEKKKQRVSWESLGQDKIERVYRPLLSAFREELLYIDNNNPNIPQKLVQYLIGRHSFYKIIKDDSNNMVIVKAFNIEGGLNKTIAGEHSRFNIPLMNLPSRIVEFNPMIGREDNTLDMILDGGWEISFRIHNASTLVENSLKFDIQLLGNPPVLFTQYLFQE